MILKKESLQMNYIYSFNIVSIERGFVAKDRVITSRFSRAKIFNTD